MRNPKMARRRRSWLRSKKLSMKEFGESTGNDYGTAYLWFREGRTPRRKYLDGVLSVHPDFPN